jgi:hypothetical protein
LAVFLNSYLQIIFRLIVPQWPEGTGIVVKWKGTLDKLIVLQTVKKFSAPYGTRRFIAFFYTKAPHPAVCLKQ